MAFLIVRIWLESSWASLVVTLAAMTGRVTLQARPRAALEGTKIYGTFYTTNREEMMVRFKQYKKEM
jgi:hypothetical protein